MNDYNGVIKDLIAGKWVNPEDKRKYGIPIKKIEIDTDRDNFLDAETAKSYGIVDSILEERN